MIPILLRKLDYKRAFTHIKWWLLYGAFMSVFNIWGKPFYYVLGFMLVCLLIAAVFYALVGIYWHIQAVYRPVLYIVVIIAMQWLLFLLLYNGLPQLGIVLPFAGREASVGKFLLFGLNIFFDIVLAAVAYIKHVKAIHALNKQIDLERALHAKEMERIQTKNQMLERELQMRKSESARWVSTINAHAVGNVYNAIYSSLMNDEQVADGFLGLKNMYDYVLENAPGHSGMVPLEREIGMLKVWSRVFKIGYESATVDIKVAPNLPKIQLPSFTYIIFIENSFEHGYHTGGNSPIRIRIDGDEQSVLFTISNKKRITARSNRLKANRPSSLGIEGMKQRLNLADIPYDLSVHDDEQGSYTVTLAIYHTK